MKTLFGMPMTTLMVIMFVLFLVATAIVGTLALLNPLLVKLALRNVPRRRAQTILITFGLMLSTLIITSALGTGDTVAYSIRSGLANNIGRVDELITNQAGAAIHGGPASYYSAGIADRVRGTLAHNADAAAVSGGALESVSIVDTSSRQSRAKVELLAVPADVPPTLGTLTTTGGPSAAIGDLGPNEVYLNKVGGDPLNAHAGDALQVNLGGHIVHMTVKAVLKNEGLAAGGIPTLNEASVADPELLLPLARFQALAGRSGQVNMVLIANTGDIMSGADHTDAVAGPVRALLADLGQVATAATILHTSAGQAALAKLLTDTSVTGDSTAKNHVTELKALTAKGTSGARITSLLSDPKVQGALIKIKNPAVAAPLAVAVASISPYVVQTLKQEALDLADLEGAVFTALFLVLSLFSIAAGVLLIFLIFVMLAAERRPEMGMARAIGTKRRHLIQQFLFEGYTYDLGAALVGVVLGLGVGALITVAMNSIFSFLGLNLVNHIEPHSLVIAFCLGALLTFATVTFSAWRVSRLNVVAALRDIPDESFHDASIGAAFKRPLVDLVTAGRRLRRRRVFGALGALLAALWHTIWGWTVFISRGPLLLVLGFALIDASTANHQHPNGTVFRLGGTLLIVGVAMLLRWILTAAQVREPVRNRFGYTLAGLGTVLFLLIPIDNFHAAGKPSFDTDAYTFFLTGILLVLGGVWAVMFNADLLLNSLLAIFGRRGSMAPTMKMAVSYPLQHKFRTGMTVAMFSLVIFLLMLISVLLSSNRTSLDTARDRGGFDIYATASSLDPIHDVQRRVDANPTLSGRIASAGSIASVAAGFRQPSQQDQSFQSYQARVLDADYLSAQRWTLHRRAAGYTSDAAVWATVSGSGGYAVVDGDVVGSGGGFGGGFAIKGFKYDAQSFPPTLIQMRDPRSGAIVRLTVIGELDRHATQSSAPVGGVYLSQATLQAHGMPSAAPTDYWFRVRSGQDVHQAALALGSAFLANGLDVKEAQVEYNRDQSTSNSLFYLMEAFMGLGLVVGVASLGVISFRSVVERRQQIGMLRAIGFQQSMIRTGFLLESSFVAILGTALGLVLGGLLGRQYVDSQAATDPTAHLVIPWGQVLIIVAIAYIASLITTWIPAWQASRVYPAEALRYE